MAPKIVIKIIPSIISSFLFLFFLVYMLDGLTLKLRCSTEDKVVDCKEDNGSDN
jgi:hypothetical protein